MTPAEAIAAVRTPEELYELLDPQVMWYSADVNSNFTCNDKEDVIACIGRGLEAGLTGRFDVVGESGDFVVVQAVTEPPRALGRVLMLRFRDGLVVEMRDFESADAALRYAGFGTGATV